MRNSLQQLALRMKECFNLLGHQVEIFAEVRNFVSSACEPRTHSGGEASSRNAARNTLEMQDRRVYVMGETTSD